MKAIYEFFFFMFRPSYWLMNNPYSKEWDYFINTQINKDGFSNIRQYTAILGGIEVWVGNHPYASFTPRRFIEVRPSRMTIYKARKRLIQDTLKQLT